MVPVTMTPNRSILTRDDAMEPAMAATIVLMISQELRNIWKKEGGKVKGLITRRKSREGFRVGGNN